MPRGFINKSCSGAWGKGQPFPRFATPSCRLRHAPEGRAGKRGNGFLLPFAGCIDCRMSSKSLAGVGRKPGRWLV